MKIRKTSLVLLGAAVGAALTIVATQPVLVGSDADAKTVTKPEVYRLLNLFGDAFEQVRSHYVERPNDATLVQTAVNGMLADLEDSYYIDPQALGRVEACTGPRCATAFGNVGVAYTMQDGLATVVTSIDDTPAAKAGIMTGDLIARVDDEQVQGLTYQQFGTKLVGEVGSTVKLTIVHPGGDKPIDLSIVRDNATRRSVRGRGEGGDIGYIRIIQFNESTADQLKKAIDDISAQVPPEKLRGYVIDLRNNPGGTLDGAIAAADGFLDDGEIVSIRHRTSDKVERFRAKAGDLAGGKPIIVLINGGSAAKAEIVAGALKDNHRATVVGTRSFGEGWDSTTVPLGPNKGALRLATGHYITPSGRLIQSNGIVPDIEAPQDVPDALKVKAAAKTKDKDQPALQSYIPPDPAADKALTAAYALLRKNVADAHAR
ncbi:MAG TPA: S41 family peptidase [Xanthobacteraceae bacterium]|nr:S41 family peptidase [Xanthobacteraceae bacterium]